MPDASPKGKRTIVYVDGFALYKGLLSKKHKDCKWLDLVTMADKLFPGNEILHVHYFTAPLKPLRDDPSVPQRQDAYLQALRTLDRLTIHLGSYLFTKQRLPYYPERIGTDGRVETVRVKRPEEKGSDVNLATRLLADAFRDAADVFVVVTNDSDLLTPMDLVASELAKDVILVSVAGETYNKVFERIPGLRVRLLREGLLKASQLPPRLQDSTGRWIHKPKQWP